MGDLDDELKTALHDELRWARAAIVGKLEGLGEYDGRRPMTGTGTNLLGLVKHLSMGESKYLGEVFGRPFPERLAWWDADSEPDVDKWATAEESRAEILQRYESVCAHADETINSLELASPGHVPWWPRPHVRLINVMAHVLAETNRHAGHADILREQIDGLTGDAGARPSQRRDAERWRAHVAVVEAAARKASSAMEGGN